MSSSRLNLDYYKISMEEINFATEEFNPERCIGQGGFGMVYKGEHSERWENRTTAIKRLRQHGYQGEHEFRNEIEMITRFNHENIISLIGYCDEGDEKIIVYDYATNGSVDHYLQDQNKRSCLTWIQRLTICLGAARALNYLHSGLGEHNRVIHRDVKSSNILLDENMNAKLSDFGLSKLGPRNKPDTQLYTKVAGTPFYVDPAYHESGILRKESDVYSFGVVMFEMLSGVLVYNGRISGDDRPQSLINLVRRYFDKEPKKLIDPCLKDQFHTRSVKIFIGMAWKCITLNLPERPTMDMVIKGIEEALSTQAMSSSRVKLDYHQISLEEIKLATEDFHPKRYIGGGAFGMVYIGELSERWQSRTAAIKRLSRDTYQGVTEFHNELEIISKLDHENIISFIGYCDESNEMIIVYEYAINGSVDQHLLDRKKRACLTWIHRLKICLGVAKGLDYLHSGLEEYNEVIHRYVKSSNILLDKNLVAKISDFELSKMGPQNEPNTQLYTKVTGTQFYVDPLDNESGIPRKASEVYSFGVFMFEILSGMLAHSRRFIGDERKQSLMTLVRRYYDNYELDKLIDLFIRDQIDRRSFNLYREIACRCINLSLEERPMINKVVEMIEEAINIQSTQGWDLKDREDEVIIKHAEKNDEATKITINCPDKIGLDCDLCRTVLFFGLTIVCYDGSRDGKWCCIVFWVMGKPDTPWSLLKKRLSETCPSFSSANILFRPESFPSKPADVFLIKFCCHDQQGLLHDMIRILCELGFVINRVQESTTPDGLVMSLFSVTDTRELLHRAKRQDTYDHLKAVLGDDILSCEMEMVDPEFTTFSTHGPPSFIPPEIIKYMFSLEMLDENKHEGVSLSVTIDNSINSAHTVLQIACHDHKGLLYDIMRTLKDYSIQISFGRFAQNIKSSELELFIVQDDGTKITDPSKQSSLCSRIRMELVRPLRVRLVNRGLAAELHVANPVELCGKGQPLVLYNIILALKIQNMDIFLAEISRHLIGGREWEVYRVLLNIGDKMFVQKGEIEEAVRKQLMGWD